MPYEHDAHRQYPVPESPWLLYQTWENILFAHWPINPTLLTSQIPPGLTLDTFDGQTWISLVAFHVNGLHPRLTPPIPGLRAFAEVNVRTYVTKRDRPGVFFLSLDANHLLGVALARRTFHLPYFRAAMDFKANDDSVRFHSIRQHPKQPHLGLDCSYRPDSAPFETKQGSLESWLTDRYCLYTHYAGRIYRADIDHNPWTLHTAEMAVLSNTLLTPYADESFQPPIQHFSTRKQVHIWPIVLDD